ncbi:unnamed protein product [Haemonchus placei]|uniref:Small RNA 2'-O-methyltransferase n=1 Tax=Haemonchus placei TaxID=6290 RepID=A0A0N4WUJ8_HAEPC|nr:unnamed protein product [Haemonchus placei]
MRKTTNERRNEQDMKGGMNKTENELLKRHLLCTVLFAGFLNIEVFPLGKATSILPIHMDRILHSYELIYDEVERNPVEATVEEAPVHMYDYDEVVSKPRIFTPPLQYQRNAFVRDILYTYMEDAGEKIRKLAVLGCGSMSLERFLVALMGSMGIERVVSVDIDENELAKGLKLLNLAENQNENVICNSNSLPVLLDVYKGDILEYDERLAGAGCVCSTEVIEHIPKEDATRYVRSVLLNIQPQLFIISTPNHEYNEVFGMAQGQFRHADHKFEFTRQQFKNW